LVVCSAYLLYDSEDPPPSTELEELMRYCEGENLYLVMECDSNKHHTVSGISNCNDRGVALAKYLNYTNLEILNRAKMPPFAVS
jgi:hypothetical protein